MFVFGIEPTFKGVYHGDPGENDKAVFVVRREPTFKGVYHGDPVENDKAVFVVGREPTIKGVYHGDPGKNDISVVMVGVLFKIFVLMKAMSEAKQVCSQLHMCFSE